jgi:hypothetical protein
MRERDVLLRHLRHAEEWLRWARSDYRHGDVHGAVLRLLLAEAEVRHAREAGSHSAEEAPARTSRGHGVAAPAVAVAAAAAVAAAVYATFLSGGSGSERPASADTPAVTLRPAGESWASVRLDAGDFFTLLQPGATGAPDAAAPFGAGTPPGDPRFVDELMSQFGQVKPTSTNEPRADESVTPGDPGRPASAF